MSCIASDLLPTSTSHHKYHMNLYFIFHSISLLSLLLKKDVTKTINTHSLSTHLHTHSSMERANKLLTQIKDGLPLNHPYLVLLILCIGLIIMDPFQMSPVGGWDFTPVRHDLAPYSQVMYAWKGDNRSALGLGKLEFKDEIFGPESLEFDKLGRGPYAGLADGRVVRWMGNEIGWETFALVTSNWSEELCAKGPDSTTYKQWKFESRCGRPLGLRFDPKNGNLYIADAYYGLLSVGPEGGIATPLATHVDGQPILFANDLDIHENGSIFFTDTSKKYNRVEHFLILLEGEASGRLLRYDHPTKTTHVVLEGLVFPNGVQLSKDQTFLLYTETTNCRIMKYYLEGPKKGTNELFMNLPGFPDNVRVNDKGEFWVAIDCCRTRTMELFVLHPWLRSIYFRLPIPMRYLARMAGMRMYTVISLLNANGEMIDVLEDRNGSVMKLVSEVREVNGKLWIGTVAHNHIATLPYPLQGH